MAALCPTAPIWSSFTESSCPVQHRQISVRSRSPDTTFITHGACLLLKRQLTFESDKLIALQGIVKQLLIRTSLEYHFGIWSGSIAGQLLWFAKPYTVLEPSESLKVNPTWSWASTMGHIVFNNGALAENLVTEIEIEGSPVDLRHAADYSPTIWFSHSNRLSRYDRCIGTEYRMGLIRRTRYSFWPGLLPLHFPRGHHQQFWLQRAIGTACRYPGGGIQTSRIGWCNRRPGVCQRRETAGLHNLKASEHTTMLSRISLRMLITC